MVFSAILATCVIIQAWTTEHCAASTVHIYEQYLVWLTFIVSLSFVALLYQELRVILSDCRSDYGLD